mgnify:CR=1 FL=1
MAAIKDLQHLKLRTGETLHEDMRTVYQSNDPAAAIDALFPEYTQSKTKCPTTQTMTKWLGATPVGWGIVPADDDARDNSTLKFINFIALVFGFFTSRGTNVLIKYCLAVKASEDYMQGEIGKKHAALDLEVRSVEDRDLYKNAQSEKYLKVHKKVVDSLRERVIEYAENSSSNKCTGIVNGGFGDLPTDPLKIADRIVEYERTGKWIHAVAIAAQKFIENWPEVPKNKKPPVKWDEITLDADISDPYSAYKAATDVFGCLFKDDKIAARFKESEVSQQVYNAAVDCMTKAKDGYLIVDQRIDGEHSEHLKHGPKPLKRKSSADPNAPVLAGDTSEDEDAASKRSRGGSNEPASDDPNDSD